MTTENLEAISTALTTVQAKYALLLGLRDQLATAQEEGVETIEEAEGKFREADQKASEVRNKAVQVAQAERDQVLGQFTQTTTEWGAKIGNAEIDLKDFLAEMLETLHVDLSFAVHLGHSSGGHTRL